MPLDLPAADVVSAVQHKWHLLENCTNAPELHLATASQPLSHSSTSQSFEPCVHLQHYVLEAVTYLHYDVWKGHTDFHTYHMAPARARSAAVLVPCGRQEYATIAGMIVTQYGRPVGLMPGHDLDDRGSHVSSALDQLRGYYGLGSPSPSGSGPDYFRGTAQDLCHAARDSCNACVHILIAHKDSSLCHFCCMHLNMM